ncbi:50S ribosomal protein L6 [Candidatus Campbellbacteria bacterium]|nr:MAG: 50S ribosomal protein L6 [Candidatus Campbellbacteria bacterium]
MSRLGKKAIEVPEKTEVNIEGTTVTVKGPLGELTKTFKDVVTIKKTDEGIDVKPKDEKSIFSKAMWGTVSSHIRNMISGVNQKFKKDLIIEGVGYRAEVKGKNLVLKVGLSHDVELDIPEELDVEVNKDTITIQGIDKEKVGLFASKTRLVKKPEPYKGKGIRYSDEVVRRKEGKKTV